MVGREQSERDYILEREIHDRIQVKGKWRLLRHTGK